MGKTFTITGYNVVTDVATLNATIEGVTYTGLKVCNVPKDTVENVKTFLRGFVEAHNRGKKEEVLKQSPISSEVAALLNVVITF